MNETANPESVKEEITISVAEANSVLNEVIHTRPINESIAVIQSFVSLGILKDGFTLPIQFHKKKH